MRRARAHLRLHVRAEPGYRHRYARGAEIRDYFERVADKYGLRPHVRLNREITSIVREDDGWTVSTKDGETIRADVVVSATGFLHHPRIPEIPGLDTFDGAKFHSARWDHSVDLAGKRVGLVGTGSTAVQIACVLPAKVGKLSIFQRTAQWVARRYDVEYSDWGRGLTMQFPMLARIRGWLLQCAFETTFTRAVTGNKRMLRLLEKACHSHLASVKDPELRRKLTPSYHVACKRLVLADEFYDEIQKPNVELVTEGIDRVEPKGIVTKDGRLHELDVLVLATGFHALRYLWPMRIVGEHGRTLEEEWKGGPKAYRTVAMPGFPNFYMLVGPHSPVGNYSLIAVAEEQTRYIIQLIEMVKRGDFRAADPKVEATRRYNDDLRGAFKNTVWVTGCQSWYIDESGLPNLWPHSAARFRSELARPRLEEFELHN